MSVKAKLGIALGLTAALLLAGGGGARAQTEDCDAAFAGCVAACASACQGQGEGAQACRDDCRQNQDCAYQQRLCRNRALMEQRGVAPERSAAPSMSSGRRAEPAAAEAAAPAAMAPMAPAAANGGGLSRAATRTLSLEAPPAGAAPLSARIFFLRRADTEPENALFYGYLIIGPGVSQERKLAVVKGLACRLEVVDAAGAAAVERLGLVSIPARRGAAGQVTDPAEMLDAYDFPRADTWLRAAGFAMETEFESDQAVLFVGSRNARARQMDGVALPGPGDLLDPIVADASGLSPRYLERWTTEIVKGVRSGTIKSRQSMQSVMEAHSWIEVIGSPLAALMRIAPASASEGPPPSSCM